MPNRGLHLTCRSRLAGVGVHVAGIDEHRAAQLALVLHERQREQVLGTAGDQDVAAQGVGVAVGVIGLACA